MRICIDARPIINKQTGLGRYTYNIINALKKVDEQNDYLILVDGQLAQSHPVFDVKNDRFIYKKCPIPGVTVQQQIKLNQFLKDEDFDVYHYPHFDLPISISKRFKSVFTVHDLTYLLHRGVFQGAENFKRWYTKKIMSLGIRHAKKIITVSDSTKNDLIDYFNLNGSAVSKVETIYEACESNFQPIKDDDQIQNFKKKWKLTRPYFLFIGEKRPHKNLVRQIEAFYQFLKPIGLEFEFIIIGKSYHNYLEPEEKTRQLDLAGKVRFLGYVADEEIPLFYNGATAFMFASLYEGFGIPILEAMACGTPVITSNISSTQEIAGDAALLVNPYQVEEISQAMIKLATDSCLRKRYIDQGFKRKNLFSWEIAARKTLNLYQQM
ncbi:glycosyltransferase family 4 protein [candidate division KSB1 bacterium]|nr:glycosyltransferase family 4 protein [candidate division KSB1 bacterium]